MDGEQINIEKRIDSETLRVKLPPRDEPGLRRLTLSSGETEFGGTTRVGYANRPSLLVDEKGLKQLREKLETDRFSNYREVFQSAAEKRLENGPFHTPIGGGYFSMVFMYLLYDKKQYLDGMIPRSQEMIEHPDLSGFSLSKATDMALIHDTLRGEMTVQQKVRLEDALDRAIDVFIRRARAGLPDNNIGAVMAASGGLAALARYHANPDARTALEEAVKGMRTFRKATLVSDGGYPEGSLYWEYAMSYYLLFGHALEQSTGDARGLLDIPYLRNNHRYVDTMLGTNRSMLGYSDTFHNAEGAMVAAYLARRFDQPRMRWFSDWLYKHYNSMSEPPSGLRDHALVLALIFRDRKKAEEEPTFPTLSVLEKMNWVTMRSSSDRTARLLTGIKGQGKGTSNGHAHRDIGSFVLYAGGEKHLVDAGYNAGKAKHHSLPLINETGPGKKYTRLDSHGEQGDTRFAVLDATDGYNGDQQVASRVRRLFVQKGDQALVILDDVVPAMKEHRITAQFQAGFKPDITGDPSSFRISGEKTEVIVRTFGPKVDFSSKPISVRHWDWHRVTGTYKSDANTPMISVLTPVNRNEEPSDVDVRRPRNRIIVSVGETTSIIFRLKNGKWTFQGVKK